MLNSLCGLTEAFLSTAATRHKDNTQDNKDNVFRDADARSHVRTHLHTLSHTPRPKQQMRMALSARLQRTPSCGSRLGEMSEALQRSVVLSTGSTCASEHGAVMLHQTGLQAGVLFLKMLALF